MLVDLGVPSESALDEQSALDFLDSRGAGDQWLDENLALEFLDNLVPGAAGDALGLENAQGNGMMVLGGLSSASSIASFGIGSFMPQFGETRGDKELALNLLDNLDHIGLAGFRGYDPEVEARLPSARGGVLGLLEGRDFEALSFASSFASFGSLTGVMGEAALMPGDMTIDGDLALLGTLAGLGVNTHGVTLDVPSRDKALLDRLGKGQDADDLFQLYTDRLQPGQQGVVNIDGIDIGDMPVMLSLSSLSQGHTWCTPTPCTFP